MHSRTGKNVPENAGRTDCENAYRKQTQNKHTRTLYLEADNNGLIVHANSFGFIVNRKFGTHASMCDKWGIKGQIPRK